MSSNKAAGIGLGDPAVTIGNIPKLTKKNYASWLPGMKILCSKLYGKQANVLKNNVAFVYPAVVAADYTPPLGAGQLALTGAQLAKLRLKAEEERNAKVLKLADNMAGFYATLWDSLSIESQQLIRVRPDYVAADLTEDPNLLFPIIRETHLLEIAGGPQMIVHERVRLGIDFAYFSQGEAVSLGAFKVEFIDRRGMLTAAGVAVPSPEEEAMLFLMKLDARRHGDMLQIMANDAMRGTPWPATLDEAYLQASTWKVKQQSTGSGEKYGNIQSSYVLAEDSRKRSRSTSSSRERTSGKKKPSSQVETRTCHHCLRKGHLARDCPDQKATNGDRLLVAIGESTDEDDDDTLY